MSKRLLGSIVLGFVMFVGSVCFILIKLRANEEGRMGAVFISFMLGLVVTVWAYLIDDRRE
jgi:O-antigen ligase